MSENGEPPPRWTLSTGTVESGPGVALAGTSASVSPAISDATETANGARRPITAEPRRGRRRRCERASPGSSTSASSSAAATQPNVVVSAGREAASSVGAGKSAGCWPAAVVAPPAAGSTGAGVVTSPVSGSTTGPASVGAVSGGGAPPGSAGASVPGSAGALGSSVDGWPVPVSRAARARAGLVARGRLRRDLGELVLRQVLAVEGRVVAGPHVAVGQVDRRVGRLQLGDLGEAGLHQVERQRRVAVGAGLGLAGAERVVEEVGQRLALGRGHPDVGRPGRDDHVAVGRDRVGPRVGVDVDLVEDLGQVELAVGVLVDLGLGQRDRDVVLRRLDVVAGLVEDLDDRVVLVERVGVLDVADGPVAREAGDRVHHLVGAGLADRAALARVVGREPGLAEERPPDVGVLVVHPRRELGRGARAVGADDRGDRQRREGAAVVVLGDRRVVPVGDLVGEDLGERLAGEAQVADQLAADLELVGERRAAGHDRQVGVARGRCWCRRCPARRRPGRGSRRWRSRCCSGRSPCGPSTSRRRCRRPSCRWRRRRRSTAGRSAPTRSSRCPRSGRTSSARSSGRCCGPRRPRPAARAGSPRQQAGRARDERGSRRLLSGRLARRAAGAGAGRRATPPPEPARIARRSSEVPAAARAGQQPGDDEEDEHEEEQRRSRRRRRARSRPARRCGRW